MTLWTICVIFTHTYISEVLQSKETADRQLNRLRKAIKSLDTFPKRYKLTVYGPWAQMNVRQFPVDNYEIFYTVDEKAETVFVLRILYGGRDIEKIIQ